MRPIPFKGHLGAALFASMMLTLVPACGETLAPASSPNVTRLCDGECKRLSECRPGWDIETCEKDCRRDRFLPSFREDYVDAIAQCIQTSTCDVITGSLKRTCWQATRPAPSDAARRACMAVTAKDRLCVGKPADVNECLGKLRWGVLKDSVLDELTKCQDMSCPGDRRLNCARVSLGLD